MYKSCKSTHTHTTEKSNKKFVCRIAILENRWRGTFCTVTEKK